MRRYHIQDRDDYKQYNRLVGSITSLTATVRQLDATDPTRIELTDALLTKLYDMGIIPVKKSLAQVEKLSTSAFCRRRLAVVMVKLKMAETLREAVTFIEQGHVRIGPETGVRRERERVPCSVGGLCSRLMLHVVSVRPWIAVRAEHAAVHYVLLPLGTICNARA